MTEYDPELVERMVALVRELAQNTEPDHLAVSSDHRWKRCVEARAIVAELPAPVDPDLLLAREVAASNAKQWSQQDRARYDWHDRILTGEKDEDFGSGVQLALAAIKRVRAEQQEAR